MNYKRVIACLDVDAGRVVNPDTLMAQVQWHQGRRRLLHQQVLREYIEARQHKQQWAQQGREHRTGPLSEAQEEEV